MRGKGSFYYETVKGTFIGMSESGEASQVALKQPQTFRVFKNTPVVRLPHKQNGLVGSRPVLGTACVGA